MQKPISYDGKLFIDPRGSVRFVNDFTFDDVKRFYEVEHTEDTPRAFHGHLKEAKYVYVTRGSVLLCAVVLDDAIAPSRDNQVYKYLLNADNPKVIYIPAGYANGFQVLEKNSKVIFFSTASVEESKNDDYRFPYDYWGREIWDAK
jgi:dTDP-4-dehydrorhamnose 3,5-epimerase